jgi:hypothetical protein
MSWSWSGALNGALAGYAISDALMGSDFGQKIKDWDEKRKLLRQLQPQSLGDIYGQRQPFKFDGMGDYLKENGTEAPRFSFDYSYEGRQPKFSLLDREIK